MGVNSLPKTVTRQRRGCDLKPGPSAPESSTLTTRLPSHPGQYDAYVYTTILARLSLDCSAELRIYQQHSRSRHIDLHLRGMFLAVHWNDTGCTRRSNATPVHVSDTLII